MAGFPWDEESAPAVNRAEKRDIGEMPWQPPWESEREPGIGEGTVLDYPVEAGKNFVLGAKSLPASALKGSVASARAARYNRAEWLGQQDPGPADDSPAERAAFRLRRHETGASGAPWREEQRQQLEEQIAAEGPIRDSTGYKVANALEAAGRGPNGILSPRPGFEPGKSLWADVWGGGGSMVAGIGISMIPYVGALAAPYTYLTSGVGETADRIDQAAVQDERKALRQAVPGGALAGATDLADLLLPQLGSTGKALSLIRRVGAHALKAAFFEGGQEGLQEYIQNVVEKKVWNPDKDVFENVPRSALIGALVGSFAGPAAHEWEARQERRSEEAAKVAAKLDNAAAKTNTEPTEEEKESGKYKKGTTNVDGFGIAIENPRGSVRSGVNKETGEEWSSKLPDHYGYFTSLTSEDGKKVRIPPGHDDDPVDVFTSDDPKPGNPSYLITQVDPDGKVPDEHKVMFRYPDPQSAIGTYSAAFSDGRGMDRIGGVQQIDDGGLRDWLMNPDRPLVTDPQWTALSVMPRSSPVETREQLQTPAAPSTVEVPSEDLYQHALAEIAGRKDISKLFLLSRLKIPLRDLDTMLSRLQEEGWIGPLDARGRFPVLTPEASTPAPATTQEEAIAKRTQEILGERQEIPATQGRYEVMTPYEASKTPPRSPYGVADEDAGYGPGTKAIVLSPSGAHLEFRTPEEAEVYAAREQADLDRIGERNQQIARDQAMREFGIQPETRQPMQVRPGVVRLYRSEDAGGTGQDQFFLDDPNSVRKGDYTTYLDLPTAQAAKFYDRYMGAYDIPESLAERRKIYRGQREADAQSGRDDAWKTLMQAIAGAYPHYNPREVQQLANKLVQARYTFDDRVPQAVRDAAKVARGANDKQNEVFRSEDEEGPEIKRQADRPDIIRKGDAGYAEAMQRYLDQWYKLGYSRATEGRQHEPFGDPAALEELKEYPDEYQKHLRDESHYKEGVRDALARKTNPGAPLSEREQATGMPRAGREIQQAGRSEEASRKTDEALSDNAISERGRIISNAMEKLEEGREGRGRPFWVDFPSGLQFYVRVGTTERLPRVLEIANVTGEGLPFEGFAALREFERQAIEHGYDGVRIENVLNDRLIPFFQRAGYQPEPDMFGNPPSFTRRLPKGNLYFDASYPYTFEGKNAPVHDEHRNEEANREDERAIQEWKDNFENTKKAEIEKARAAVEAQVRKEFPDGYEGTPLEGAGGYRFEDQGLIDLYTDKFGRAPPGYKGASQQLRNLVREHIYLNKRTDRAWINQAADGLGRELRDAEVGITNTAYRMIQKYGEEPSNIRGNAERKIGDLSVTDVAEAMTRKAKFSLSRSFRQDAREMQEATDRYNKAHKAAEEGGIYKSLQDKDAKVKTKLTEEQRREVRDYLEENAEYSAGSVLASSDGRYGKAFADINELIGIMSGRGDGPFGLGGMKPSEEDLARVKHWQAVKRVLGQWQRDGRKLRGEWKDEDGNLVQRGFSRQAMQQVYGLVGEKPAMPFSGDAFNQHLDDLTQKYLEEGEKLSPEELNRETAATYLSYHDQQTALRDTMRKDLGMPNVSDEGMGNLVVDNINRLRRNLPHKFSKEALELIEKMSNTIQKYNAYLDVRSPPGGRPLGSEFTGARSIPTLDPSHFTEAEKKIYAAVEKIIKTMAPTANVRMAESLEFMHAAGVMMSAPPYGTQLKHVIYWALRSHDPIGTVKHELIHFFRASGLITPSEWNIISKAAERGKWMSMFDIESRYKGLDLNAKLEEAVAEYFSLKWNQERLKKASPIDRIFNRLKEFKRRVASRVREIMGKDRSLEDIFTDLESGRIGRRVATVPVTKNPTSVTKVAPVKTGGIKLYHIENVNDPQRTLTYYTSRAEAEKTLKEFGKRIGATTGYEIRETEVPKEFWEQQTSIHPYDAKKNQAKLGKKMLPRIIQGPFGPVAPAVKSPPISPPPKGGGPAGGGPTTIPIGTPTAAAIPPTPPAGGSGGRPRGGWFASAGEPRSRYTFNGIYTRLKDELNPIRVMRNALLGRRSFWRGLAERLTWRGARDRMAKAGDPYWLARLTRGTIGLAEHWINYGTFSYNNRTQRTGAGLREILQPVRAHMNEFLDYALAKRAIELHGRGIDPGIPLPRATAYVSWYDANHPEFATTQRELVAFQRRMLVYARDAGLISDQAMQDMARLNQDYIPYFRILDAGGSGGPTAGGSLKVKQPTQRIRGSDLQRVDPLESIIKNTYLFLALAERNRALRALGDLADASPRGVDLLPRMTAPVHAVNVTVEEMERWLRAQGLPTSLATAMTIFRPNAFRPTRDTISYYQDGRRIVRRSADPDLAEAVNSMDQGAVNWLAKLIAIPAKTLRAGAVFAPEFIARNPVRDALTALVLNMGVGGSIPVYDMLRGLGSIMGRTQHYQDWLRSGAARSALVGMDRDYVADLVESMRRPWSDVLRNPFAAAARGLSNVVRMPYNLVRHPLRSAKATIDTVLKPLQIMSELMENATRIGKFRRARLAGADLFEAGAAAREITLDFQRIGSQMHAMNAITAFFNPQVEGVDMMFRAFAKRPVATMGKMMLAITIPSILLWLKNYKDDRYKDIPRWQKDLFWIVMTDDWKEITSAEAEDVPTGYKKQEGDQWYRNDGTIYRIPKPFELGVLFGSVPERMLEAYVAENPRAYDNIMKSVQSAMMPTLLPNAIVPPAEQFANRSFFTDRPLVPDYLKNVDPEYQSQPFTSETAKMLGAGIAKLGAMLGEPHPGASSPLILENYIRGWTGGLGMHALDLSDKLLEYVGATDEKIKPTPTLADLPLIKAFVVRNPGVSAQPIQDFYEKYNERKRNKGTMKYLNEIGEEDEAKKIEQERALENDERTHRFLGSQIKLARGIYRDKTITPEEKRELLDKLYLQMINVARGGNARFEETEKKPEPKVAPKAASKAWQPPWETAQ